MGQAHLAEVRVNRQREEQFNDVHGLEGRGDVREEWTNLKLWEKDGSLKSSLEYFKIQSEPRIQLPYLLSVCSTISCE